MKSQKKFRAFGADLGILVYFGSVFGVKMVFSRSKNAKIFAPAAHTYFLKSSEVEKANMLTR